MDSISNRLKIAMTSQNLKQTDLVEKTGISKGALSSYISGRYIPKQKNIHLLAKALCVSESWLMGFDVPMERPQVYIEQTLSPALSSTEFEIIKKYRKADNISKEMVHRALGIELKKEEKGLA